MNVFNLNQNMIIAASVVSIFLDFAITTIKISLNNALFLNVFREIPLLFELTDDFLK